MALASRRPWRPLLRRLKQPLAPENFLCSQEILHEGGLAAPGLAVPGRQNMVWETWTGQRGPSLRAHAFRRAVVVRGECGERERSTQGEMQEGRQEGKTR